MRHSKRRVLYDKLDTLCEGLGKSRQVGAMKNHELLTLLGAACGGKESDLHFIFANKYFRNSIFNGNVKKQMQIVKTSSKNGFLCHTSE